MRRSPPPCPHPPAGGYVHGSLGSGRRAPMSTPARSPPPRPPPAGRRVRARLSRLGAQRTNVNPVLEPLYRIVRTTHPKADLRVIDRAYDVAEFHHRDQLRKSGDPYITHPLAV